MLDTKFLRLTKDSDCSFNGALMSRQQLHRAEAEKAYIYGGFGIDATDSRRSDVNYSGDI
jgi:hypothetical protein